jgi:hypothetical protein
MADYKPLGQPRIKGDQFPHKGKSIEYKPKRPTLEFADEVKIVYDELMSLLLSKHRDYGPRNIADAPGGAINGLRVRMHDKLARINNLVDSKNGPEHESLEDSFKDMANYAIIGMLLLRDKWDK